MKPLWSTPQALFDKLHREFQFTLDVCALPCNAKCEKFFSPDDDGLSATWGTIHGTYDESVWMNPPYGSPIGIWLEKAYRASGSGVRVVALIPNHTNAPWWHDYVMHAREIRFIKHKVSFEDDDGNAEGVPFWGSVIVVFGPGVSHDPPRVSSYLQPKHEGLSRRSV